MMGDEWASCAKLAALKLTELGDLKSELDRFIEAEDLTAREINAIFERTRLSVEHIQQIDRQLGRWAGKFSGEPELSQLAEDSRALARKIMNMTRVAYEKAERLTEDCRTGLAGVQQKKWILAQFASHPIEPGSLLDYSEQLTTNRKK
ncbi:MAG TPA: hypothetical protein VN446_09880 [Candidatus Acidoferrum sp.]|nr:hypothetical protein [Candidatus Acidoferrum sp.]